MKRAIILTLAVAMLTAASAGLAHAVVQVTCDQLTCQGTKQRDNILGTQIDNTIFARAGGDTITDNVSTNNVHDHDVVYANKGNDVIDVSEGNESPQDSDTVRCGSGTDTVYFDQNVDTLSPGCERKFPE